MLFDGYIFQISNQSRMSDQWLPKEWLVIIRQLLLLMNCEILLKFHWHAMQSLTTQWPGVQQLLLLTQVVVLGTYFSEFILPNFLKINQLLFVMQYICPKYHFVICISPSCCRFNDHYCHSSKTGVLICIFHIQNQYWGLNQIHWRISTVNIISNHLKQSNACLCPALLKRLIWNIL